MNFQKRTVKTYEFQKILPRLPVPSLGDTCARYLKSVQPFLNSESYEKTETIVKKFLISDSSQLLQNLLVNRASKTSTSWLETWWNDTAYLEVRDPILINVNYGYGLKDSLDDEKMKQTRRAALLVDGILEFKRSLEMEILEPDASKSIPLCMTQYKYLFGACRIPHIKKDIVDKVDSSKIHHIIVARHGQFYLLNVYDKSGISLPVDSIEKYVQN